MKLLSVRREGKFLYLDTDVGIMKNCFPKGQNELERKARSLINKHIEFKTWQPERFPPEDGWFSEIWEASPIKVDAETDNDTATPRDLSSGYKKDFEYGIKFKTQTRQRLIGPPGTGKTHTLIGWVKEELAAGIDSRQIAFVAFTRVAAHTAADRINNDGEASSENGFPNFSTIHSLATRMGGSLGLHLVTEEHLREFDPRVYVEKEWTIPGDANSIVERHKHPVLQAYSLQLATGSSELTFNDDDIDDAIDALNSFYVNSVNHSNFLQYAEAYIKAYENFKRTKCLADFNDVLLNVTSPSFNPEKIPCFEVLFVDEAQDLSKLQWRFIELLAKRARRTIVSGDDDQAIMAGFGASPESFINFTVTENDWPLPVSNRIPPSLKLWLDKTIIPLIESNPDRIKKHGKEIPKKPMKVESATIS